MIRSHDGCEAPLKTYHTSHTVLLTHQHPSHQDTPTKLSKSSLNLVFTTPLFKLPSRHHDPARRDAHPLICQARILRMTLSSRRKYHSEAIHTRLIVGPQG